MGTSSVRVCDACGSRVKLDIEHIHATTVVRNEEDKCCSNCKHYLNQEGNWYYTRGGGTCKKDSDRLKKMKMPNSLCHCGNFTHK